jgi:hypothetical protein
VKDKIERFLQLNHWVVDDIDDEYVHYIKPGNIAIDVNNTEIVLIDDNGDFFHIPMSGLALSTLIGKMIIIRSLAMDFKYEG